MTQEQKRTALPLTIGATYQRDGVYCTSIFDANGELYAEVQGAENKPGYTDLGSSWEKAEEIIRALNSHYELLDFAKNIVREENRLRELAKKNPEIFLNAWDAISVFALPAKEVISKAEV